jgi:hypothetical protein
MTPEGPRMSDEEDTSPQERSWFRRLLRGKPR